MKTIEVLGKSIRGKAGVSILLFLHNQIHDRPELDNHSFGDRDLNYYNKQEIAHGSLIATPHLQSPENKIDHESIFTVYGTYGKKFIKKHPDWFKVISDSPRQGIRFILNYELYNYLQKEQINAKQ